MDLVYKIYSVYLYDNQLNHDWIFLFNRRKHWTGELSYDAPFLMFGSSDYCASSKIYSMDKNDPNRKEKSVKIMLEAAKREGIKMIKAKDFLTLDPIDKGQVSYSGALPGDTIVTEGKYKGLKKQVYTPYEIIWNETKSGINPHEFEVMGVWKEGSSQYSTYRIWEEKSEREKLVRDYKLNSILL